MQISCGVVGCIRYACAVMMIARVILCSVALSVPVHAALEWENDFQEFERKASDGKLEVQFRYKNTGTTPVVIKNVEASCNCTTAEIDRREIRPGEGGVLDAVFTFGKRVGMQQKSIVVETSDNVVKELRFRVKIADRVKVEPSSLVWGKGDAVPKKVMVYTLDGYVIPQIRAVPTDARLTATLEAVREGEVYEVTVRRKPGNEPFTAKLRVETGHGTPLAGVKVVPVTVE